MVSKFSRVKLDGLKGSNLDDLEVSHQIIEQQNYRYFLTLNKLSIIAPKLFFFNFDRENSV